MRKTAVLALILLFPAWAFGDNAYSGRIDKEFGVSKNYYTTNKGIADMLTEAQIFDASVVENCNCRVPVLKGIPAKDPGCRERYMNFYKNKAVNFKIVFGYTDLGNGYSLDPIYRAQLKNMITKPNCAPGVQACGFKQERPGDSEHFVKTILGPDNQPRTIRVALINSSSDISYKTNEANYARQEEKSEHAENAFYNFCNTELSMYLGHMRHGCGPGFHMLKSGPDTEPEDGAIPYCDEQPLYKMESALNRCQPKLLSIFGCSYKNAKRLYDKHPNMGYQRPAFFTYFPDWAFQVAGTLNGLMGQVCEPSFSKMVNPPIVDPKGRMSTTHF